MSLLATLGAAGIGSLISGGLNLGSSLITNLFNKSQSDSANEIAMQNNQWQKDQYFDQKAYNENLQKELFKREDTSYQRTVDDITKSGLSPLAINGTNDSGSIVSNASVPELSGINPFQANSLNFGQFADILARADERAIQNRKLDIEEQKNLSDKQQKELDRKQAQEQFESKLSQDAHQFNQSMDQRQKELESTNKNKAEELKLEQQRINTLNEQLKLEQDKETTRKIEKQLQGLTGGKGHTKYYANKEEYDKAFAAWRSGYCEQLALASLSLQQATMKSNSGSQSKSVGGGAQGFASIQGSYSDSNSHTAAWSNADEAVNTELLEWLVKNPMPVHY